MSRIDRVLAPAIMLAAVSPHASAATAAVQQAATYRFELRGVALEEALLRYARVTGRQIIFQGGALRGLRAPDLVGDFDADEALASLLRGTPAKADQVRPGVFVITAAVAGNEASTDLAQVDVARGSGEADDADPIVVTGSLIRGAPPVGSSVTTIDREAIDRSTRSSVADAIALLPQNSGSSGTDAAVLASLDRTSLNYSLGSGPNLRGLGSDATLTLVNGRRQAGSGGRGDFTDISTIPLAAVERIEVLKDGASAIYGSDAVGGVVNVILKRDFDGADVRLRSGIGVDGGPANHQASLLIGARWGGGGLLAAYEFDRRGSLASADRDRTRTADLRRFGGSDWRQYYSAPPTVLRLDPVARAYVPAFAAPATTDRPTRSDFTPGRNLENQFALTDILPEQERHSVYGRAFQEVLSGVEVFVEGRWSRRRFAYALAPSIATFAVTAANPFFVNPEGAGPAVLAYSFGDDLGAARARGWVDAASLTGGVTADLGAAWQLDAYYVFSRERMADDTRNLVNSTALNEALGTSRDDPNTSFSAPRDGYFNPFGSGASNGDAVRSFIASGRSGSERRSSLETAVAKLDGPLLRLPAGSLRMAVGGAWRRDKLSSSGFNFTSGTSPTRNTPTSADRTQKAVFGELSAPVFDEAEGFGFGRLTVSAAVRHESYDDFGDTTNPKIGATWSISRALEVRTSWGTSFRAPSLPEVRDIFRVAPTQLATQAGTTTPVLFLAGGNPSLRPETAETLSLGIAVRPLKSLRLDVGYFRTSFDDRIDRPAVQNAVRALIDPTLSPFVVRIDPATNAADLARVQALLSDPGAVSADAFPATAYRAIVDGRYVNTSRVKVEGFDFDLAGSAPALGGTVTLSVSGSYLIRFDQQLTPTSRTEDLSSTVGYPADFKTRASVNLSGAVLGATLSSSYVGAYRNIEVSPSRRVSPWLTVDLQLQARVGGKEGLRLALDARNLFDRAPPFVDRVSGIGYDPANADVLGRVISVQVSSTW